MHTVAIPIAGTCRFNVGAYPHELRIVWYSHGRPTVQATSNMCMSNMHDKSSTCSRWLASSALIPSTSSGHVGGPGGAAQHTTDEAPEHSSRSYLDLWWHPRGLQCCKS